MMSQISSLYIVYSTVYSCADERKHHSSASLAFVRGIHRWPVNSPHKWPLTRKMFPFDDVIMKHTGDGMCSDQISRQIIRNNQSLKKANVMCTPSLAQHNNTWWTLNTLKPRQNGHHFPGDMFKCIFLNENVSISIKISLKFVLKGPINSIPAHWFR